MKNLFKSLVALAIVFFLGNVATSCVSDPNSGDGTPVLQITGEAVVNNAISVDVPVRAANLSKLAYLVEEYVVLEDGTEMTIKGYDANKKPILNREVSTNPNIAVIFRSDKNGTGMVYENITSLDKIHISGNQGLDKAKKFVVYIAAITPNKEYYNNGEILSVKFETPDKYSDNDVEVIRETYEGIEVFVQVPQNVKKENRRIRWGIGNIAALAYNYNPPIAESLFMCDFVYPATVVSRDTTLVINHYNAYRRNAKGEIGYYTIGLKNVTEVSPDSEEAKQGVADVIQYYDMFQPGEPLVLRLGEAYYCSPETGLEPNGPFSFGYDVGWYWFPYDYTAYYTAAEKDPGVDPELFWNEGAWFREVQLTLPGPKLFDGTVGVNVSELSSNSGKITFTPDNRTFMYLIGLYEERDAYQSGFKDITDMFLRGNEAHWQWFTTSQTAGELGIVNYFYGAEGVQELRLENYFQALTAGGKYHLVVNAVGAITADDGSLQPDMTAQNFQHFEFQLKDYTLPEPRLIVTAVDPNEDPEASPWKVKFNVKNPDWKSNPVKRVSFVANYTREFDAYMKATGYTYTDMVMMNAGIADFQLNDADVELVNSNAGAIIEFDVLENSSFTAAFRAWNAEGNASNPDSELTPGYAVAHSLVEAPATPLDMTKLNELKGDWTATATVNMYNGETGVHTATQRSWKVTIGDLNASESLTQAQYAMLESHGVSREVADAYLADYNNQAAKYNERLVSQNRVLCLGWAIDDDRTLSTTSPWSLFLMEDYNASIVDYLFQDFGPKWFLQVDANGNIFVPVHSNRIPSLTSWFNGMDHYLCGGNYETGYAFNLHPNPEFRNDVQAAGLPVTLNEDGSIVINGYTVQFEDEKGNVTPMDFYPNVLFDYYGQLQFYNNYISSSVVLTKGWNGTESSTKMSTTFNKVVKATKLANGTTYTAPKKSYGHTTFVPQTKKNEVKVITAKYPTREELDIRIKKHFSKRSANRF